MAPLTRLDAWTMEVQGWEKAHMHGIFTSVGCGRMEAGRRRQIGIIAKKDAILIESDVGSSTHGSRAPSGGADCSQGVVGIGAILRVCGTLKACSGKVRLTLPFEKQPAGTVN